ncbi:MAG: hypothetical protein SVY53_06960 [Chloroflexota bacterium]|nr:hypothetical protein [Chloroflexota bacterium]
MSDWEATLSPLMRERLAKIGDITPEEKELARDQEILDSILSEFHKGDIDSDVLGSKLKELKTQGKKTIIKAALVKLTNSLTLQTSIEDFRRRRDAILVTARLRSSQHASKIELSMNTLEGIQKRYSDEYQQTYESVKAQIERNPQLRMEQVKQGRNTVVMELSVEDAIKRNPQWREFVAHHDNRYGQAFYEALQNLNMQLG